MQYIVTKSGAFAIDGIKVIQVKQGDTVDDSVGKILELHGWAVEGDNDSPVDSVPQLTEDEQKALAEFEKAQANAKSNKPKSKAKSKAPAK